MPARRVPLEDPSRLLEGAGKRMRHVKVRGAAHPNTAALESLIGAAYLDIEARLEAERGFGPA